MHLNRRHRSDCVPATALTGEANSTLVVPAATKIILPMAAGATVTWFASDPVQSTTQVGYVGGSAHVWSVMGQWTVAGGDFVEVSETFDATGTIPTQAMIGPCNPKTFTCP